MSFLFPLKTIPYKTLRKTSLFYAIKTFSKPNPVVKWAGGKRQIIHELMQRVPENFETYYEPFVGGGALLFELLPDKAVIGDKNYELINAYLVIRDRVEELIEDLKKHENSKDYYKRIRSINPEELDAVARASRFLYLNKTCYNGLWRVNSKGEFNVPFGNYKNPKICDEENLRAVSQYLRKAEIQIIHGDYKEVLKKANKGDFVYLDPPYAPVSKTANFTKYLKDDFTLEDQIELAQVFKKLDEIGCYVMLSNSNTDFIKELYRNFVVEIISSNRMINCKANKRRNHTELIIRNYK